MIELGVNQYLQTDGTGTKADPFTIAMAPAAQHTDYLIAKGTRDATTGDGTPVIAANATKYVEYHTIKIQRIAATGDQVVMWKNGSTVLDECLIKLDSQVPGLVMPYDGKVCGSVNTAQYFNTDSAVTFKYWILYRLVTP